MPTSGSPRRRPVRRPGSRFGLGYGFAGVKKQTAVVGPAMTSEIMMTARRFSAAEAKEMGRVNRVVPVAELEATVFELASQIAAVTIRQRRLT
jgi:enoyl-CoA hydratase